MEKVHFGLQISYSVSKRGRLKVECGRKSWPNGALYDPLLKSGELTGVGENAEWEHRALITLRPNFWYTLFRWAAAAWFRRLGVCLKITRVV